MARIPENLINEIRNKADIVEIISRYVTLAKRGKNYWGLSPFRDDRNPSLSVSPEKQIFMDFATREGGNVFNFIQKIENLSYPEAVIRVAGFVNIDVSQYENTSHYTVDEKTKSYHNLLDAVNAFSSYQLFTQEGKEALNILENRGYSHDLLKTFGVGVVLDNNQIHNYLSAKGFEIKDAIKLDVLRFYNDQVVDVFYNRIMFPIHDSHGNLIAFSARAIRNDNPVKYINTGQTPLYTKGNVVYNFHRAKDEARKQDLMIITEGVTDSIAFTKAGHKNVVSLLGVFCTDEQLRILKQASSNFLLAFDGDKAGQEASYNVGKKLIAAHCKVAIWYNDSGLDPDEALRKHGESVIESGFEYRLDWYDFLLSYAIGLYGLESFESRRHVLEFYLKHFKDADELQRDHYLKILSEKTGFNEATIRKQLGSKHQQVHKPAVKPQKSAQFNLPEKRLLAQMLNAKEAAYIYRDELGYLINDAATELGLLILDAYRHQNKLEVAELFSQAMSDTCRILLGEVIEISDYVSFNTTDVLENIALIKKQLLDMGVTSMRQQIENKQSLDDQKELFEKALDVLKTRYRK